MGRRCRATPRRSSAGRDGVCHQARAGATHDRAGVESRRPCNWVAADEVYGNNSKLRQWLEEQRLGYVLAIASDQRMRWPDHEQRRMDTIAQSLPNLAWERISAGSGSKGERLYDWTMI